MRTILSLLLETSLGYQSLEPQAASIIKTSIDKPDILWKVKRRIVIKTVIFDFGGVLYKTPDRQWLSRWGRVLGFNEHPEFTGMMENPHESTLVRDICLGVISEQEMWHLMAEKWHIKPRVINTLRQQMNSKRRLNKPLLNLLAKLQEEYQTAILSNAGDDSRQLMEKALGLDRFVEEIIISAEEGLIKPDAKIYQLAMDRLGTKPKATLFIDDLEENVIAARAFGMHALHYTDTEETIQKIQDILERETS